MEPLDQAAKLTFARLPPSFRRIWLEPVPEKGQAERSASNNFVLVAPLEPSGRIDVDLWRQYHEFCSVFRFCPGWSIDAGRLVRKFHAVWALRFDAADDHCRLSCERFVIGSFASIQDELGSHWFKVAAIEPIGPAEGVEGPSAETVERLTRINSRRRTGT